MALTFGSVASNLLGSTSALTTLLSSSSSPSSLPTSTHSIIANPWDPSESEGGGGMNVQSSSPGNILPLGPVFGSSAAVLLAVVLVVRWKRYETWRGVFGLGDGNGSRGGLGAGSSSVNGDADSSRPWLWDAYISPREKGVDVTVDSSRHMHWRDVKPLSASYTPPMPPPYPDPSDPLSACPTRTTQSSAPTALQKIISATRNNANCACQQQQLMSPPNLLPPARRLRVSVLISMPTPPRPPVSVPSSPQQEEQQQQQRTYDNHHDHSYRHHDDNHEQNDSNNDNDYDDNHSSSSSSFSEIEEEKLKARAMAAEIAAKNGRECTADLSLVLGIAEVDMYDSYGVHDL